VDTILSPILRHVGSAREGGEEQRIRNTHTRFERVTETTVKQNGMKENR